MIIKAKSQDQDDTLKITVQQLNQINDIVYNTTYFNMDVDPIEDPQYLPLIYKNRAFSVGEYDDQPVKLEQANSLQEIFIDMSEVTDSIDSQKTFSDISPNLNYILNEG